MRRALVQTVQLAAAARMRGMGWEEESLGDRREPVGIRRVTLVEPVCGLF